MNPENPIRAEDEGNVGQGTVKSIGPPMLQEARN